MATFWRTLLLLLACSATMVASRGRHRHRHGFHHLKKHLHRLHLNHLKEKLLSTVMPTTMLPELVTEEPKYPEISEKVTQSGLPAADLPKTKPKIKANAEIDSQSDGDVFRNLEFPKKDSDSSALALQLAEQRKKEKWVSYDELKKTFKYDDKSTLPILDKPIYDASDDIGKIPQEKEFRPVSMPKRFVSYDKNKDGFISKKELQKVTGAVENSDQAFTDTDKDGDGYISPEEFMSAPWVLEDDPDENMRLEKTRSFLKTRMQALDFDPEAGTDDDMFEDDSDDDLFN